MNIDFEDIYCIELYNKGTKLIFRNKNNNIIEYILSEPYNLKTASATVKDDISIEFKCYFCKVDAQTEKGVIYTRYKVGLKFDTVPICRQCWGLERHRQ